ncbi:MAG: transposase [Thiotrichaceae bacterium]|nr:transposase [Thiotrichaceae bacterium]
MKKEDLSDFDRIILRKCTLLETVFGQLKSISQIEHLRHRSLLVFMVNVLAGLIAYSWKTKKSSLNLRLNPDFSEWAASRVSFQPIIS